MGLKPALAGTALTVPESSHRLQSVVKLTYAYVLPQEYDSIPLRGGAIFLGLPDYKENSANFTIRKPLYSRNILVSHEKGVLRFSSISGPDTGQTQLESVPDTKKQRVGVSTRMRRAESPW